MKSVTIESLGLIKQNSSFLIALPKQPSLDVLASALALQSFLVSSGKTADVVGERVAGPNLSFLPGFEDIKQDLDINGILTVVLNTKERKLSELSYDTGEGQVSIMLKAENGVFEPGDVSLKTAYLGYDVLVSIGARSFEDLTDSITNSPDLFYSLPKLNIDISPDNEYFGTTNIVEPSATALSEVVFEITKSLDKTKITPKVATSLLTGLIAHTNSFQSVFTTPGILLSASELVEMGADQQLVIRHLFKTKELELLKLWGRALARLKTQEENSFAYTILSESDFEKTQTNPAYCPLILQEFLDNVSEFKVIVVAYQFNGSTGVLVNLHPQLDSEKIAELLTPKNLTTETLPRGLEYLRMELPGSPQDKEAEIIEAVKQSLPT